MQPLKLRPSSLIAIVFLLAFGCSPQEKPSQESPIMPASFSTRTIADSIEFAWAYAAKDITNDGIADLVYVHNNARGGHVVYYEGRLDSGIWNKTIIADSTTLGGTFAQGDMELADMDNDGDIDVLVAVHPGEWDASTIDSKIYWLENPSWDSHLIGTTPDFVKDFNIADFDKDGLMDITALTFESSSLSLFSQDTADTWERVLYHEQYGNLHEGMNVGDINGDGWTDIVANAHIFYNPEGNIKTDWKTENLDSKWNSQTADWSRNGTKTAIMNIDEDTEEEVVISHSERSGYPLSVYQKSETAWDETKVLDSIPACHTIQLGDFNKDGYADILTGSNYKRALDLGYKSYPVMVIYGSASGQWQADTLHQNGIYNGHAVDFDQDGDLDIISYQTHDANIFELYVNETKTP